MPDLLKAPTCPGQPDEGRPLMRSRVNPVRGGRVDWSVLKFRHEEEAKRMREAAGGEVAEGESALGEFDTRIAGPWMRRWPIR